MDISLSRRILRDFQDKTKTKEEFLEEIQFYLDHPRPLFFDEQYKKSADLVLDGVLSTAANLEKIKLYLNHEKRYMNPYRS